MMGVPCHELAQYPQGLLRSQLCQLTQTDNFAHATESIMFANPRLYIVRGLESVFFSIVSHSFHLKSSATRLCRRRCHRCHRCNRFTRGLFHMCQAILIFCFRATNRLQLDEWKSNELPMEEAPLISLVFLLCEERGEKFFTATSVFQRYSDLMLTSTLNPNDDSIKSVIKQPSVLVGSHPSFFHYRASFFASLLTLIKQGVLRMQVKRGEIVLQRIMHSALI